MRRPVQRLLTVVFCCCFISSRRLRHASLSFCRGGDARRENARAHPRSSSPTDTPDTRAPPPGRTARLRSPTDRVTRKHVQRAMISLENIPQGCEAFLSDLDKVPFIQIGDFKLRLELDDDLSPELLEVAVKELRETPEQQEQSIAELKALLEKDKDLKAPIDNRAWLIRFLRPTKYYPESAYKLIKQYYQFKVKHSNIYDGLSPKTEKNIFDHDILHVLPKRDQGGRRILVIELGKKWKHKKCSLDEVYKGAVIFLEAAIMEPATQVAGAQVVFDMDGLSLQQTWQFSPPFAKRIVDWLQDSVPARVKGIHIVNQPMLFNVVFNFFKPFLREKLRSRIVFHGTDRQSLHKHLYQPCLPECYGGTLDVPSITGPQWHELLLTVEKEFEVLNKYGYGK